MAQRTAAFLHPRERGAPREPFEGTKSPTWASQMLEESGAKGTGLSLGIDRKETGRKAPLELSAKHTIDRMAPAARQQNSEILQHQ